MHNFPNTISNIDLCRAISSCKIRDEIKKRRFRWFGHVLGMKQIIIPTNNLTQTSPDKRRRDRPRTTWKRIINKGIAEEGLSINNAEELAND